MKSILVVDDMAVFREPIAASLRLAGYETFCAEDGEEALRSARANHPGLILLDVSMPKMDGLTFLKHLRADASIAKTPIILLTALAEKKHIMAAASLGVKDYLLKSRFRLADLLERIKKFDAASSNPGVPNTGVPNTAPPNPVPPVPAGAIAPAPTAAGPSVAPSTAPPVAPSAASSGDSADPARLLTREQFLERVEKVFQTKTLSGVVGQVIAMASSPRTGMSELAEVIARDPMLSARVLQTANSASYASSGAVVTTIPSAIRKIGCNAIRNLAAALGVFDCMPDAGPDGFNPIRCWQHSFAVAQLCERLASAHLPQQSGLAYVVGLCHDLGDIFIRTQFSKEYQQVSEAAARTGLPREQLHGQMLGMTPAQMISSVLKCVGLPQSICEPITIRHSPGAAQTADPLARILWMADAYANAAMLASSPGSEVVPLTRAFCRAAAGDQNPSRPDPASLRAEVQSLTVALARLSAADEAKLLAPLFKTYRSKWWIAREQTMSEFDPVAVAAASLASATVSKCLPAISQIGEIDALIVVASSQHAPGFSSQDIERVLAKPRAEGRNISVLAIAPDEPRPPQTTAGVAWRNSIALSDLAALAEAAEKKPLNRTAA